MNYKVYLYFEGLQFIKRSGIGKAFKHQTKALQSAHVKYTVDKDDHFDILHINTVGPKSEMIISKSIKEGKKIIYHAHTTEEDFRDSFIFSNHISGIFKKRLQKLYGMADVVITPTPYSKSLLEGYGLEQPIYAISNGIDLKRFKKSKANARIFYEYFNFKPTDFVVVSVGHYFKRKGIIDYIEMARLNPHIKFVWFGHTPASSIQKDVRTAFKDLPNNLYLPGYMDGDIISGAYSGANLFMFMSYEETEGIVVLEALASEIQVIVRDIPVYADWLEDGVSCYKAQDLDGFQQLLDSAYHENLSPTITNGYELAKARDLSVIGKQLQEVYEFTLTLPQRDLNS